jgi:hypothetical protein
MKTLTAITRTAHATTTAQAVTAAAAVAFAGRGAAAGGYCEATRVENAQTVRQGKSNFGFWHAGDCRGDTTT